MVVEVETKPKPWFKPPRHCRRRLDEAGLRRLGDNIAALGMFNPIEALPDGEIISGYHRWLAALAHESISDIPVRIIRDPLTARDIRIRRFSENLQRSDLSFYDKYLECRGFREDEPEISALDIAAALNVSNSTITRYLCLDHCIEAVRVAAMEGRLRMKSAYEISKADHADQEALLLEALAGSAGQVAKVRKRRSTAASAARAPKIKVLLPSSGVTVTVGGQKPLSLEEALAELAEAMAELRKAEKQGHDARTYMAITRKRIKAKP